MEDLSRFWGKLSLSDKEEKGYILPKVQRKNELMIAAKFLTTRALNMEAVGRTFMQVWRSCDGFKMRNMTDHKVLFAFVDERDVNQIQLNQPWSFDKHLVVVERYDKDAPLRSLSFKTVMFWVQVHDIPMWYMTTEVAENICDTIGEVVRSIGAETEEGSCFIRGEDKQFGPSLRAPLYRPSTQKVIFVPGFYDKSGLEEDSRSGSGKVAHGEPVVAENKETAVQGEENSNMETEEFGEELMTNSNNDGATVKTCGNGFRNKWGSSK
ncbi:hypothetical protein SO802_006207 [Lithocarpus litseifolius]|uniref:DUF4283 domain-containing protein n=1 Tax=Lithocarpus litseifolius TaxID=425828 RepID=A0AAW2DLS4_9ROSI